VTKASKAQLLTPTLSMSALRGLSGHRSSALKYPLLTQGGDGAAPYLKICSTWQMPQRDSERRPIVRLAQDSLEQPN
jgi:hypothetical protein